MKHVDQFLMPEAVLCDMDGTLVDSECIWFEAERAEFGALGIDWTIDDQNLMIGWTIVEGCRNVLQHYGLSVNPKEIGERIAARVLDVVVRDGVEWRPGAYEFLQMLDSMGIPFALVTSSFRDYTQLVARRAPGRGFATLVTGDAVEHGKPHPEPYLRAAQKLGVTPSKCVAFEDSGAGITSAYRAGVVTVAVPYQGAIPELEGLHILESLEYADAGYLDSLMRNRFGT